MNFIMHFHHISVISIAILRLFCVVQSEVFTAMSDIEGLVESERQVVGILRNFIQAEEKKLSVIKKYIKGFTDVYEHKTKEDISKLVTHPLNAFSLVKLLGVDWTPIRDLLKSHPGDAALEKIEQQRSAVRFTDSDEDMKGAAEAIMRLQHTYKLEEKVVASGKIPGLQTTSPSLTSLDCYLLGYYQAQLGFHVYAAEWLKLALEKYEEERKSRIAPKIGRVEILDWLGHSVYNMGNITWALSIAENLGRLAPNHPNGEANIKFYQDVLRNIPEAAENVNNCVQRGKQPGGIYEALCRGEGEIPPKIEKEFKCYLETYGNPALLLQPVKTEIVYKNPDILVLHNVATDGQLERLKAVGKKHLLRSMVVKQGTTESILSKVRISKSAFLIGEPDPVVPELNKRIGLVTNMNMGISEDLQVANYGLGGMYDPHHDHFRTLHDFNRAQITEQWGDRIATFLLYLTDVEAGGATVFPRINVTLFPEKGSAAFWFDLHRDLLGDEQTLHAGCPVLCGTKWISNKWIREKWQDVTRPCGLQPDSPEWVNGWPSDEATPMTGACGF